MAPSPPGSFLPGAGTLPRGRVSRTRPGQGLGTAADSEAAVLEPVMSYRVIPEKGTDPLLLLPKLMELIDRMLSQVPVYRLRCRNDITAAEEAIAYFGL